MGDFLTALLLQLGTVVVRDGTSILQLREASGRDNSYVEPVFEEVLETLPGLLQQHNHILSFWGKELKLDGMRSAKFPRQICHRGYAVR